MIRHDHDSILADLDYVSAAVFTQDSPQCLDGTRVATIDHFVNWATNNDPSTPQFKWLYGPAGTGKSSLMGSIAARLRQTHNLGAFYAFRRGDNARRNISNIFSTIAVQLATKDPVRQYALVEILQKMKLHERTTKSHSEQLQLLISNPCNSVSHLMTHTTVIIIDALDEFEPADDREKLIKALSKISLPTDIRVLIASRPEVEDIRWIRNLDSFNIEQIADLSTDQDISLYITTEATLLKLGLRKKDIEDLVDAADRLFQWAVMALRILWKTSQELDEALEELINNSRGGLDELYKTALDLAVNQDGEGGERARQRIRFRLGALLTIREPIPLPSLVCICDSGGGKGKPSDAKGFKQLAALLIGVNSNDQPVRPLHASLREYLIRQNKDDNFYIDISDCEKRLATSTLQIMKAGLQFNIGKLKTSYLSNQDQPILKPLPAHLSYACHFWDDHIRAADALAALQETLIDFMQSKFLFWLEVLSLNSRMKVGQRGLTLLALVRNSIDHCI